MIDLVIVKYGRRKKDKRKCSYRAKRALTRLDLWIGGEYGDLERNYKK